jgi:hypothetical protein
MDPSQKNREDIEKREAEERAKLKSPQKLRTPAEKAKLMEANKIASAEAKDTAYRQRLGKIRLAKLFKELEAEDAAKASGGGTAAPSPLAGKMKSPELKAVAKSAGMAEASGAGDRHSKDWLEAEAKVKSARASKKSPQKINTSKPN